MSVAGNEKVRNFFNDVFLICHNLLKEDDELLNALKATASKTPKIQQQTFLGLLRTHLFQLHFSDLYGCKETALLKLNLATFTHMAFPLKA